MKGLAKKLSGYRQQDRKFAIYSEPHFVKAADVEKLLENKKCYYCAEDMLLEYPARHPKQWTLDRIDNTMGHNTGNVLACCLACNLQRRNRSVAKFLFTKTLSLVKLGAQPP